MALLVALIKIDASIFSTTVVQPYAADRLTDMPSKRIGEGYNVQPVLT